MTGKLKRCWLSLTSFILNSQLVLIRIVCIGSFVNMGSLMSNLFIMLWMSSLTLNSLGKLFGGSKLQDESHFFSGLWLGGGF